MNPLNSSNWRLPRFVAAVGILALALPASSQEMPKEDTDDDEQIEEVVVTGRFISSSQQLVNERMSDAFATDLLGEDTISRLGDSTVGAALRRVPPKIKLSLPTLKSHRRPS